MVKLVKWFDTEATIILLLQYAGGGRLLDFVLTYQTKQIAIIPHEISPYDSACDGDTNSTFEGKENSDSSDALSNIERKNAMTVLAAFAEHAENNRLDLNGSMLNFSNVVHILFCIFDILLYTNGIPSF